MVLAAGLGTRLRPLTADRPKALVEVAGRTLLEITLARLRSFGVRDVIVNVHYFADLVIDYLRANTRYRSPVSATDRQLGEALGQIYVQKYFPPEAKARALDMVNHLTEALRDDLQKLPWMGPATKKQALTKLAAFAMKAQTKRYGSGSALAALAAA